MVNLSKQIKEYIDFCECMKGVSVKTKAAYQTDLKQFKSWHGNDYDWCNKPVILNFISFAYKTYKPRTAKRKIASLKAFFHYLETEEIIEYDPFHKVNYKRKEALILPRTFPSSVLSKILNYAYASFNSNATNEYQRKNISRDIAVFELLFASGVRVGELCSLKNYDVDIKQKLIKVNGKGNRERYIQITNPSVLKALRFYKNNFSKSIDETGYFFINNRGRKLQEQSVRCIINKYVNKTGAGIHITPHMFRHTVATMLTEEDVDIRYIQELLGHSSIQTTQIYTHISLSAQKKILSKKHPRNKIHINI